MASYLAGIMIILGSSVYGYRLHIGARAQSESTPTTTVNSGDTQFQSSTKTTDTDGNAAGPTSTDPSTLTSSATSSTATDSSANLTTGAKTSSNVVFKFPAVGIAAGADLQNWSLTNLNRQFADFNTIHATWMRHDFAWDAIEPTQGTYTWSGFDQLVNSARSHNLNVIATIGYTPSWANGGHADHDYQPSSAAQFGQYAGKVASRYAPKGVHVYEVWNEPNIGFWQPNPDPAYYTQVLCSAYQAIHASDSKAIVVTGGTSPAGDGPTTYSPQTWLTDLYSNNAKSCFDGVGHHPYIDSSSTPGDLGNAWDEMYDAYPPSNLRGIMTANNDAAKRIWATEVGCNRVNLGDAECSARLTKAFAEWKGFTWSAALNWFIYWDPKVYGLVDGNWTPRPEYTAYQQAAAAY